MAKKTTKKTETKKQQCKKEGCKRVARADGFCKKCSAEMAQDPMEQVVRLSEIERLRFVEADQAMLNHTQEVRLLQQEQKLVDVDYMSMKQRRQNRVNELQAAIKVRTLEQRKMLAGWGEKYNFNPAHISIDDQTGVIQEHLPDEKSSVD